MIAIHVSGTGGSGKSTLVRRVMELYPIKQELLRDGRKRPIGYALSRFRDDIDELYVPGHYETACGGCDTIKTVDEVYSLIASEDGGAHMRAVMFEGIMVQDDVTRAVALDKHLKDTDPGDTGMGPLKAVRPRLYVIRLNTPVETCLERIRGRRAAAGNEKPLSEKNTRGRYESQLRRCQRLKDAGVAVEVLDGEAAFARCRELLGV